MAFTLFGPSHLAVLALTIALPLLLTRLARRDPSGRTTRVIEWGIAATLGASLIAILIVAARSGPFSAQNALPMHLCEWTAILLVVTLLTRWRLGYELSYFWGLAGTTQAILTPDLAFDFPDIRFLTFFAAHCGVVVGVLFLTLAENLRPVPRSIFRAFLAINIYLVVALVVNALSGANYGYLCAKPAHPSLMDYLGPWPWYILSLEGIALASFALCYAPFFFADRRKRRNP